MKNIKQTVQELNLLYEATNRIAEDVQEALQPFIDRKVFTKERVETKRVQERLGDYREELPMDEGFGKIIMARLTPLGAGLTLQVKAMFEYGPGRTTYHDTYIVLGELCADKQTLFAFKNIELKELLDYETEKHAIERFKELRKKADGAYLAIHSKLRRGLR